MPACKKLTDMDRGELLHKCQRLIIALNRKHDQLRLAAIDLPPNKAANDRHQKHKLAWGRTKKRLLDLLNECLPHVPAELAKRIQYDLDHAEFLYQRRLQIQKTVKRLGLKR